MRPIQIECRFGHPIPDDEHAVSVCLPTWKDNIDYEEGKLDLRIGYPRFLMHPLVKQLNDGNVVFPNKFFSDLCAKYCGGQAEGFAINNTQLYIVKNTDACKIRNFWQHTGLGISSRYANDILNNQTETYKRSTYNNIVKKMQLYNAVPQNHIFLFSSGMTAIFTTFLIMQGPYVMFGFPYIDTLKIIEKYGKGQFVEKLEDLLKIEKVGCIFLEFPSNPLLSVSDLEIIYQFATSKKATVVIDDTITTFYNASLLTYCDVLVTSLTKSFSGYGNVCAGSVIVNPKSNNILYKMQNLYDSASWIYQKDLEVLDLNSNDYEERLLKMQNNSTKLLSWLKGKLVAHSSILKRVFHPEIDTYSANMWKKYCKGSCHLFSIEFCKETQAELFFDSLNINKGPSLGNWTTLICPYTILAHFNELDWARQYGVAKHLLRISVGCEEDLIERLSFAFDNLLFDKK
eukprot:NODE_501_length_6715_cov_0.718259.p3 type:complete len:458 gc:universal NODE_501_length_6715_cov_0.718259:5125-3752(-)